MFGAKTLVFSCKMKEKYYKLFLKICGRVCEMGKKRHVWERVVFAPARDSQASTKESFTSCCPIRSGGASSSSTTRFSPPAGALHEHARRSLRWSCASAASP